MRIKSIELAWFRGAAEPVSLEPDCKSMVVYGENGSGKSSFVDAVEYAIGNGSIEHLRTEYSGSNQARAIPNTHKPDLSKTALRFKFKDDSELKLDFNPNGSSQASGAGTIGMPSWEYRQTILRQGDVSRFIHDTKGAKYSALLPMFGLHKMETAAENLRQLARSVATEAKLIEKKANLQQTENQRKDAFGTLGDEDIIKDIRDLFAEYCQESQAKSDALSCCNELETALDSRIADFTIEDRVHVILKAIAKVNLKHQVDAARTSQARFAESVEPLVVETLAVLQSARAFGETLEGIEEVDCPACGQRIAVNQFLEHVEMESGRLEDIEKIYGTYRTAIKTVCAALDSLKLTVEKQDLKTWRDSLHDAATVEGLRYLDNIDSKALRASCTADDLNSIESNLWPIVAAAKAHSKDAPPSVQKLVDDKKRASASKAVFAAKTLSTEIANGEALIALLNTLEQGVRFEIRHQAQRVIDSMSGDIQSMWATLHPNDRIDNVRLFLPPGADKAIDVALKFHGKDQDSPRLTLSEGYRNSLGLCIFLAMAKQVVDTERPLILDDVVVSLDRNHRGMIQELLVKEFGDRQMIVFTHDREWYTELRYQLNGNNQWRFKTLLPYESPDIGIRWSHKTTTFDDARALITARPDAAGNDARKIMDVELPLIAEGLKIRIPYLRSIGNDRRMAHEFLVRLLADGKKCFQKRSGTKYTVHTDAINALNEADRLLLSWGNRASHTFDIAPLEAEKLIDACEIVIAFFRCDCCNPPANIWRLVDEQSKLVQCNCGEIRWRYGKA